MKTLEEVYPLSPVNVSPSVIAVSKEFKKEAVKVFLAILFFAFSYLCLIALACCLAALCIWGGYKVIVAAPGFYTLLLGIGLIATAVLTVYFLIKFLFVSKKRDLSSLIQISREEEPVLFAFIEKITKELKTPFPKRIYLSPEVNASVFYESSFRSMFLPVKKNLVLGMGFINTVNISEFKAVIAHEFGHFSQHSMRLGSYVYNMNTIIYNMLYDNEEYNETLQSFARVSGIFSLFALFIVQIVKGIQWIQKRIYAVINKTNAALSRQMEFHADAVSAYVSGSAHLPSALYRIELAQTCYHDLFAFYNKGYNEGLHPENIYHNHLWLIRNFAEYHDIPLRNGLPAVNGKMLEGLNYARVNIGNQWSSHPETKDREDRLLKFRIASETDYESAWGILADATATQLRITKLVYSDVKFTSASALLSDDEFDARYLSEAGHIRFNKKYRGYYDARFITPFNTAEIIKNHPGDNNNIFQYINEGIPQLIEGLKTDIGVINAMRNKRLRVKSFDFNGIKYKAKQATEVYTLLHNELTACEEKLLQNDRNIFLCVYWNIQDTAVQNEFLAQYENMFSATKIAAGNDKVCTAMTDILYPLYSGVPVKLNDVIIIISKVQRHEKTLKQKIKDILENENFRPFITAKQRMSLNDFCNKENVYMQSGMLSNHDLSELHASMNIFREINNRFAFSAQEQAYNKQLELTAKQTT